MHYWRNYDKKDFKKHWLQFDRKNSSGNKNAPSEMIWLHCHLATDNQIDPNPITDTNDGVTLLHEMARYFVEPCRNWRRNWIGMRKKLKKKEIEAEIEWERNWKRKKLKQKLNQKEIEKERNWRRNWIRKKLKKKEIEAEIATEI